MRIPESWLRSFVNPPISSDALSDLLTMAGLEVEELQSMAPDFSGVVVAHVISVEKHPDADRLRVCRVDIGAGQGDAGLLQIVCGAPNVVAGMWAACATEGAVLPGGFKIKRAKMRGVESQGMLCSAKELGIAEDAEGLMVLPSTLAPKLGSDLRQALELDAKVLTLKLTPNRADCLSIVGVAREVAALTSAPLTLPSWPEISPSIHDKLAVKIQAPDLCGRFSGRVIKGVNAKAPTPDWMRSRLEQAGQRSISALVDISNYVMLELGRPSHVFDLDRISGDLTVRWAKTGERLELLNGQTVALDPEVGVIADQTGPESLAGIMGGQSTAVSLDTQNVYLEAAFWWPDSIRGRARRFNFTTDAGHRFERGVDPATTVEHVNYITHLIQSICGGQAGPIDDQVLSLPERKPVSMRVSRCAKILGIPVTADQCKQIFDQLGFVSSVAQQPSDTVITVTPPSYRFDLEIEEDLIEEVARIYGFDHIPARPPVAPAVMLPSKEGHRSAMQIRQKLAGLDYFEAITYSFVSPEQLEPFAQQWAAKPVSALRLLNPMASHQSVMRTSLLPGLLDALVANVNRKQSRVRLFEIGRVFHHDPESLDGDWTVQGVCQPMRVAGVAYGPALEEQWGTRVAAVDFFDVKADLEALAAPLELRAQARVESQRGQGPASNALHPGRSAALMLGQTCIGYAGELHPALTQGLGLPQSPVVFELDLEPLQHLKISRFTEVSKFPVVTRDLAVVLPLQTPAGQVLDRLQNLKSQLKQGFILSNIKCFDEYKGKGLSDKEKSLAFRFILQSPETTLQDSEVDAVMEQVVRVLESEFSARLRT